jgi:hypothetical protein
VKGKAEIIENMFSHHNKIKLEYSLGGHRTMINFGDSSEGFNRRLYSRLKFITAKNT